MLRLGLLDARLEGNKLKKVVIKTSQETKFILNKSKAIIFQYLDGSWKCFFGMQLFHEANIVCDWKHFKKTELLLKSKTVIASCGICA